MLGWSQSKMRAAAAVAPEAVWPRKRMVSNESQRITGLVTSARQKLEPIAAINLESVVCGTMDPKVSNKFDVLGGPDGMGFLLKMAVINIEADDGAMSEKERLHFEREFSSLMERLTGQLVNYSVLLSLYLTIYVSLLVLHAGREPYDQAASTLKLAAASYSAAAGDAASYLWPQDPEGFRFFWYVVEVITLSYALRRWRLNARSPDASFAKRLSAFVPAQVGHHRSHCGHHARDRAAHRSGQPPERPRQMRIPHGPAERARVRGRQHCLRDHDHGPLDSRRPRAILSGGLPWRMWHGATHHRHHLPHHRLW